MKEKDLFCEEHGYLGSSSWFAVLEFLASQHIQQEGTHVLFYQWGREISDEERMTQDIDEVLRHLGRM